LLVTELIERNARRRPHREALVGDGVRLNHLELAQRIEWVARCLARLGIVRGDRVLVQMSNKIPYVELYFAVPKIGAILAPLNVRLTPVELPYFISHSGAVCLVADLDRATEIERGLTDWGEIRERIVVGGHLGGWRAYEDLAPSHEVELPRYEPSAENDVIYIYYTSGTTGRPKGAMWTHRQVIEQLVNLQFDLPINPVDTSLVAVNLSHGPSVLPVLHQVLYVGGRVILYSGLRFQAEEFADLAVKEGVSTTLLVPTMLHRLLQIEDQGQDWFEGFKYIKYAAAKMDPDELEMAVSRMQRRLTQGYGSTETVGGVTFLSPSEHNPELPGLEKRLASAGREYINVRVAIMDDQGRLLPPGEVGQIVVRSDKNFAGYWQDPGATEKAFKDGWLLTGDLGRLDDEGYLYVVDRLSDMIISGGENIYPVEIEEVINRHVKVKESAVVGIPDAMWGESVKAFVILKDGERTSADEIVDFCRQNLASYKKPKFVEFVDELPKNSMGKVLKYLLRGKHSLGGGDSAISGS
jgi:acyl-CoA synthetase (AMP-forming)/AMP-acid ligase II